MHHPTHYQAVLIYVYDDTQIEFTFVSYGIFPVFDSQTKWQVTKITLQQISNKLHENIIILWDSILAQRLSS